MRRLQRAIINAKGRYTWYQLTKPELLPTLPPLTSFLNSQEIAMTFWIVGYKALFIKYYMSEWYVSNQWSEKKTQITQRCVLKVNQYTYRNSLIFDKNIRFGKYDNLYSTVNTWFEEILKYVQMRDHCCLCSGTQTLHYRCLFWLWCGTPHKCPLGWKFALFLNTLLRETKFPHVQLKLNEDHDYL